ncbi:MAG: class I SAM-dependent methyltransferase [Parachlamydiales bacterium]|nr:class I SAM-dependent methyltransferase [Parachlamydiales bacterium]
MGDSVHNESQRIWDELGHWWDANVEDGDAFHQALVFPGIEKLLNLKGSESIFDAGCGNGSLARRMAKTGAKVYGVDFSSSLIEKARLRSPDILFDQMDLTDLKSLEALANIQQFDRIVSSMVLHNVSNMEPFFSTLKKLLKPKGSFVFSIPHPCFNSFAVTCKEGLLQGEYNRTTICKVLSKPGQPIEQIVFERSIQEYFNLLIDQGMHMTGFFEPCIDTKTVFDNPKFSKYQSIPPVMISRWAL